MSTPTEVAALVTATNNLTQNVINTRTQITNTVNAKITQLNNWKNALTSVSIFAGPRYVFSIDLKGKSTGRYYPVWWQPGTSRAGCQKISFVRHFSDDQDGNLFPGAGNASAGLILEIEQTYPLGTKPNYFNVTRLGHIFRKTVRNIHHAMHYSNVLPVNGEIGNHPIYVPQKISPSRSGLYLRGGLSCRVISNYQKNLEYSTEDGEVEMNTVESGSVQGIYMVKSYGINDPFPGAEYEDFMAPYNAFPVDL